MIRTWSWFQETASWPCRAIWGCCESSWESQRGERLFVRIHFTCTLLYMIVASCQCQAKEACERGLSRQEPCGAQATSMLSLWSLELAGKKKTCSNSDTNWKLFSHVFKSILYYVILYYIILCYIIFNLPCNSFNLRPEQPRELRSAELADWKMQENPSVCCIPISAGNTQLRTSILWCLNLLQRTTK